MRTFDWKNGLVTDDEIKALIPTAGVNNVKIFKADKSNEKSVLSQYSNFTEKRIESLKVDNVIIVRSIFDKNLCSQFEFLSNESTFFLGSKYDATLFFREKSNSKIYSFRTSSKYVILELVKWYGKYKDSYPALTTFIISEHTGKSGHTYFSLNIA